MLTYKLASAVGHGSVRREGHGLVDGYCPGAHLVTNQVCLFSGVVCLMFCIQIVGVAIRAFDVLSV